MREIGDRAVARRWRTAAASLAAVAAGALALTGIAAGAPASGAKAPRLITAHNWLSTKCVPAPQNTMRASVAVRMVVVNYDGIGDWAKVMKVKARLVPTTAGLNFTRPWKETRTTTLLQNRRYSPVLNVTTDNVSSLKNWKLQLKLVWDRPGMKDVVVERSVGFRNCGGPADGIVTTPGRNMGGG